MLFSFIMFTIFIALLAFLFGGEHLQSALNRKRNQNTITLTSLQWEAQKEITNLLPVEVADSVFSKVEAEWEKEHPDIEKELRKQLAEKQAVIASKNKVIASHEVTISKLLEDRTSINSDWTYELLSGSESVFTVLGRPAILLPKNASEEKIREVLKKAASAMAQTVLLPVGSRLTIPRMEFISPDPIAVQTFSMEEGLRERSMYEGLRLADLHQRKLDNP